MFRLRKISLYQFRNYESRSFQFNERIIGISGNNGRGKTNLLDAIYYLCFTKSYFSRSDLQVAMNGSGGFRAEGHFQVQGHPADVLCVVKEGARKEFAQNGEPYEKFSAHIGKLPCVMIAPDDVEMITGASEERRRFMDTVICQLDADYLRTLIEYNKILQQRNSCLRSLFENKRGDQELLDVYDRQLSQSGRLIFEKRKIYLDQLLPAAAALYAALAPEGSKPELQYESQLASGNFLTLLSDMREKDIILQRTQAGVHRDNLEIRLEGQPFKYMASQGQRKSLLFALKLAEFELLKNAKGFAPLLLLDDLFEKLDAVRMHNLLSRVCAGNEGQVFITDAHGDRISKKLLDLDLPFQLIEL